MKPINPQIQDTQQTQRTHTHTQNYTKALQNQIA